MNKYTVNYIIADRHKTIGANITTPDNLVINIRKEDFIKLRGKIDNAIVTYNGIIRAKKGSLKVVDVSELINTKTNKIGIKINTYTIMYREIPVLSLYVSSNEYTIHNEKYLPFGLRNKNTLSAFSIYNWIKERINNINRTYMNVVYIAREIGRNEGKVLKDSCGISFTDDFWIKTSDIKLDWSTIKRLRDTNINLCNTALTGKIDTTKDLTSGYTSLFTTKGHFPKAVYNGWLYKRIEDAILEYPAYLIAKQLHVNVAESKIVDNYVAIKLFTTNKLSLVHAGELREYFGTDDEIYNEMYKIGRFDIVEQMQRMYIFNFIIGNPDLHEDNYGVLYNSDTFEWVSLSPCFDHNIAFMENFQGLSRGRLSGSSILVLDEYTKLFIKNHTDILNGLRNIDLSEVKKYLSEIQYKELLDRIKIVLKWGE